MCQPYTQTFGIFRSLAIITQHVSFLNINWRDVQIKNGVNNVDMSSLKAPWQNDPYTENKQNNSKTRRSPRRNRHSENKLFLLFFSDFVYIYVLIISHQFKSTFGGAGTGSWNTSGRIGSSSRSSGSSWPYCHLPLISSSGKSKKVNIHIYDKIIVLLPN